jgi:hypothetical protein
MTVPLAIFVAVISAAASITDMIQPPKMLPIGLMCDGVANMRDASSPRGSIEVFGLWCS